MKPLPTASIRAHEKVWEVREYEGLSEDYKSLRRWQECYVMRDGQMYVKRVDLGPAILYPGVPELRLISMGEDEMQFCVESIVAMRQENSAAKMLAELGPSDLLNDYRRFAHERWELMHNRSVFGPGFKKERNLFAHKRRKYGQHNA